MKPLELAVVGAGNRGYLAYGKYAETHPGEVQFVAVAEPDNERRARFAEMHGIAEERQFRSWEDLVARPQLARGVYRCTLVFTAARW